MNKNNNKMRFSMRSACVALVTISLVYLCYTYFWGPLEGHNNNNGNTQSKVLKQSYYREAKIVESIAKSLSSLQCFSTDFVVVPRWTIRLSPFRKGRDLGVKS